MTDRQSIIPTARQAKAQSIPELPIVLLVLFLVLFFPMLNLGTATMRVYFLRTAVLNAAHDAAKACTYGTDLAATSEDPACPSAVTRANNTLTNFKNSFSGISIDTTQVFVVRQPLSGGQPIVYPPGPISQADIRAEENQYYIEVAITGTAQPLITVPFFSGVPGLGGPMPVNIQGRELFEQVEGLAK